MSCSILSIIKKYNVELPIFLYNLARFLYQPSVLQSLMTDKICANDYNLDPDKFCYNINLPEIKNTTEAINIQKDVVQYTFYQQLILSIPAIVAAVFLGPWLDEHAIGPKIIMILNLFAGIFEAAIILIQVYFFEAHVGLILISHVFNGLFGGQLLYMTSAFAIAMKSTPLKERTFRFTIIEFSLVLPNPTGSFISSFIFPLKPLIKNQIHNYVPILLLGLAVYFVCLCLVIFTIGKVEEIISIEDNLEKRLSVISTIQPVANEFLIIKNKNIEETSLSYVNSAFEITDHDKNNNFSDINLKESNRKLSLPPNKTNKNTKGYIIRSLFRLSNLKDMIKCLTKKREHDLHKLLWCVIYIYIATLTTSDGVPLIMVPFVTTVYGMNLDNYLRVDSIGVLAISLISVFFLSFLHKIDLMDTKKIFIGLTSLLLLNLIRGVILYPIGLYLSYILGSVLLCSVVSCRGFVSKIVKDSEIATILSLLGVFYASCPILSSLVYTQVFKYSVSFFPGLAFIVASSILFVALLVNTYLHINYVKYEKKMTNKKSTNDQI